MTQEQDLQHQVNILNSIKGAGLDFKIVLSEKKFAIGQLLNLAPGSVLIFGMVDEQIESNVHINNQKFSKGAIIQIGENYGIQIGEFYEGNTT